MLTAHMLHIAVQHSTTVSRREDALDVNDQRHLSYDVAVVVSSLVLFVSVRSARYSRVYERRGGGVVHVV